MLKSIVLAGTAAASIAVAGLAFAQQSPRGEEPRARASLEDRAALGDARIAGLRAGLRLSAEQEKHWPAVEAALREMQKERLQRIEERQKTRAERRETRQEMREARREAREAGKPVDRPVPGDMIERLRRGADAMSTRADSMKRLADAAEPLYKSLDDGQKRRLAVLMRGGMRPAAAGWQRHGQDRGFHRGHERRHDRGYGPGHDGSRGR